MNQFLNGCLAVIACRSLIQDFYGMEQWLAIERAGWVSGWYTVPVALVMLAFVVVSAALEANNPRKGR